MEKEAAGKGKTGRKTEREQERERTIRVGGRIEVGKKSWGGQQDGEGVKKKRGRNRRREQDRGIP